MKNQSKAIREGENPLTLVPKTRPSYEDIALVNPKKEALRPAILRTFEGFTGISDEEADNICRTSLLFAQVLLDVIALKNTNSIDNQHFVYSNSKNETPVIDLNSSKSKPTKNKAA